MCMIEADIEVVTDTQQVGVRFRYDPERDLSYAMNYQLHKRMWNCICMPRTAWGKLDEFSLQRVMPQDDKRILHVALLLDHDVATLYVNDSIALNMRTCNGIANHMAFYVCHGIARIKDIRVTQIL